MKADPPELPIAEPRWLAVARKELGVREVRGEGDNPRVLEYLETVLKTRLPKWFRDETPWCAAFVQWCLIQAGIEGTGKPNARSYITWGKRLDKPRVGCIAVLKRGKLPWQGHVTFVVSARPNAHYFEGLGGNQGNQVCVRMYSRKDVLAYVWPEAKAKAKAE